MRGEVLMARKKKVPRSGPPYIGKAREMLELLEDAFPEGIPTGELAAKLFGYDAPGTRARVYRLARSLRGVGHAVYGLGGIYYLCTPEKMKLVGDQRVGRLEGTIEGFLWFLEKSIELCNSLPRKERDKLLPSFLVLREQFKDMLKSLLQQV